MIGDPPGAPRAGPWVVRLGPGKHAYCMCKRSRRFPVCDGTHRTYRDAEGNVYGPVKIVLEEERTVSWCACGRSASRPYCDGSHRGVGSRPSAEPEPGA